MADVGGTLFGRLMRITLVVMLATFPLVAWGMFQAMHRLNDDALDWSSSDLAARRDYEWFNKTFGSQDAVMVSWTGATLDDPRLAQFARALRHPADGNALARDLIRDVMTGPKVLEEITSEPLRRSPAEAARRLRGTFVGPDGRTTCAVVLLGSGATTEARNVVRLITETAEQCGVAREHLRLVGYVVEVATLDTAALETLYRLALPSAVLVILVAWPFLRSLRLAVLVWLGATFCQCACLAAVFFWTGRMNGMMTIIPILLLVVFVSSAVELLNYYQAAVTQVGLLAAPARGVALGAMPCFLAVTTTAFGVGSLVSSGSAPVREFAVWAMIGTMFTWVLLLVLLPGAMHLSLAPGESKPRRWLGAVHFVRKRWSWDPMVRLVERRGSIVLLACLAITVFFGVGLQWMRGSTQLTDYLSETTRAAQDRRWFQENLGPLLPVEIVVAFNGDCPLSTVERLELVDSIEEVVRAMPGSPATISLAAFLPSQGALGGARATMRRTVLNRRLDTNKAAIAAKSPYLAHAEGKELWRITTRLESSSENHCEESLAAIQEAVAPLLADAQSRSGNRVSVVYTGMLPLVAACHSTLIRDLGVSFATSLVAIGAILIVGLRSVRLGLLSVLPSLFPVAIVFGAFGWLGQAVDVGSMMTASVGLGIAVDGTTHFLTWFVRGWRQGMTRNEAIAHAYHRAATAVARATVICGAGLAVYGFSSFLPAARFGWIVCLLLLTALVGDLLLLPALLAGPVGKHLFPDRTAAPTTTP